MTYDEAVSTIVERYKLGALPGWTMCDFDSAKMWRTTKDGRYEIVELMKLYEDDSNVGVSHTYFDPSGRKESINELTAYEIRLATSTGGDNVLRQSNLPDVPQRIERMLEYYLKIVKEA
jgi:hypothetical protein